MRIKTEETALRPARFPCADCGMESGGRLILRTHRSILFGIPLCKDSQSLVQCDVCGAEQQTLLTESVFDPSAPIPIYNRVAAGTSSFPKLMIILFGFMWCVPLLGLILYWSLFDYGAQIRGGWLRAYGSFVWLTLVFHIGWAGVIAYLAATGSL